MPYHKRNFKENPRTESITISVSIPEKEEIRKLVHESGQTTTRYILSKIFPEKYKLDNTKLKK